MSLAQIILIPFQPDSQSFHGAKRWSVVVFTIQS